MIEIFFLFKVVLSFEGEYDHGSAKLPLDGWIRHDGYDAVAPSSVALRRARD